MKKSLLLICVCAIIAVFAASCGGEIQIPAGNINSYGYVLVDGSDIYYTKVIMTDISYYSNIYKYNTATKKDEIVAEVEVDYFSEMNAYLTMHGGYLYFLPYSSFHESPYESSPNIYRVKPDGENIEPEALLEGRASVTFMQIKGGVLYYYDDDTETLYSMSPNGTNRRVVCEAVMDSISISGGKAYFVEDELLMSVSLKGGEPQFLFDFWELDDGFYLKDIVAEGNYIYYADDEYSRIGRIRTNGKNNEILYTAEEEEYIIFFNVSGESIFIVMENYGKTKNFAIISVSTKGGAPRLVISDAENFEEILPLSIWGETIYFNAGMEKEIVMESDYAWFTVRKGGGKPIPFRPFTLYDEFYDAEDEEYADSDDDSGETGEE